MSNTLAIGAVTATLRNLLTKGIAEDGGGLHVTTMPPDKAQAFGQDGGTGKINLFLYHTQFNAACRNMDIAGQTRPGGTGQPPVALDLFYLLTAYEKTDGDPDVLAHRLLGRAMRVLHDHPLLGAEEIRAALPDNDLADQIERIRITPQPLSLEELSKLWMIFQTGYRISAAYQVSLVLIESTRPTRAPLPVLGRGDTDRGPAAEAGANLPIIKKLRLANQQSSALLGDEVLILGRNLSEVASVSFTVANPHLTDVPAISIPSGEIQATDDSIKVALPNDAEARTKWVAGFYTVKVLVNRVVNGKQMSWSSNALPISLAPRIETIAPPSPVQRDANGEVTLTLTCSPEVRLAMADGNILRFNQQVMLLLGTARQIAPEPPPPPPPPAPPAQPPTSTTTITFRFPISATEVGEYLLRLSVDDVNLPLIDRTVTPPRFDPKQKVTIQ